MSSCDNDEQGLLLKVHRAVPLSTACTFNKHLLQMPSCLVQIYREKKNLFVELFSISFSRAGVTVD